MKELVITLMIWIGGQTGFLIPEPPILSINTPTEIRQIMYQCDRLKYEDAYLYDTFCIDDLNPESIDVIAVYDDDAGIIYLPTYFDMNNMAHKAILLHELIHHVQFKSGFYKKVRCRQMLEKQAYDLMDIWLEENDAVMPVDLAIGPILRFTLTTCRDNFFQSYIPEDEAQEPVK